MITHSPPRRAAALLTSLAVAVGALILPSAAVAAEGPAPSPMDYRVIGGVHADTVSTFVDGGLLALGSKADVAEGNRTRFAAEGVRFHLESQAKTAVPAGYGFIGELGSDVWIAPESNPGTGRLWPGFNTESVAVGAVDGDLTTFTLTNFEGPGDLEVFTGGGFGAPTRLWSSRDGEFKTFDLGRTHMHANWAFTAAGAYTLGVEGSVTIGGVAQTASATYTFVVGDLPEAVATATSLTASATALSVGDPVTLTAAVAPADMQGYVEFRNGTTVLGHEPVNAGSSVFATTAPAVGNHSVTAVFIPSISNDAQSSTSAPVAVTVTDGSGVEFAIGGIATSYEPGNVLEARVVGHTLEQGQTYLWAWRPVGVTLSYALTGIGGQEAAGMLTLPVDMSHNDYEISVSVRQDRTTVTRSPWVPLLVQSDVAPVTGSFPAGDLYLGDDILFDLDGAPVAGDSVRLAYRYTSGPWTSVDDITTKVDDDTLRLRPTFALGDPAWVAQTVRDGVVVAQSEPFVKSVSDREVIVQGLQGVYRVGQTLRASAEVHPTLPGATYTWELFKWNDETMVMDYVTLSEGGEAADLSVELPIEAHHDGWVLSFEATLPEDSPLVGTPVAQWGQALGVSASDPDTQLFFFQSLGEHYHQGVDINLNVAADPAPADGDSIVWEWKWPNSDNWVTLPGAAGLSHAIAAEQALHGVEVRATLKFAGGEEEMATEPVTIRVDDHGEAARQKVSITGDRVAEGAVAYADGEEGSLTANVSTATVLNSYQWFLKLPDATEAAPIQGATSATFDFRATSVHDGAEVSVAVVTPDGSLAYGPSAPVLITVKPAVEGPVSTTVTISGLAASYAVGDSMSLTASQDPQTREDHWHWFIKPAGSDAYGVISGELTSSLSRAVSAEDAGASIIARLYDHDHAVIAESAPVTVVVKPAVEEPVSAKPSEAPSDRTAEDLGDAAAGGIELGASTVKPGDFLVIDLGAERGDTWVAAWLFSTPTLLGGDWAQASSDGSITVRIPANASLGAHRMAVFAADGSLVGWANLSISQDAAVAGGPTSSELSSTGVELPVGAIWVALMMVFAGAALLVIRRRSQTASE